MSTRAIDNFGSGSPQGAHAPGLSQLPLPSPKAGRPSWPLAPNFRRGWIRERARILQRLCERIEEQHARGASVVSAARRIAKRWNGRPYKTAPGRRFKLSAQRLRVLYYRWKASGKRLESFGPAFRPITKREPAAVQKLTLACLSPAVASFRDGCRAAQRSENSACAFYRAFPPTLTRRLGRLFAARRAVRREEMALNRLLGSANRPNGGAV